MGQDRVVELPTDVDQAALAVLGWHVDDFRARVVGDGDLAKLATSLRAHLDMAEWLERFSDSGRDDTAPPLVISVTEPGLTPVATLIQTYETLKKARKGIVHSLNGEYLSPPDSWRSPGQLRVSITAFDSADVGISGAQLLRRVDSIVIEADDQTTKNVFNFFDVHAQMLRTMEGDSSDYRIRLQGSARVAGDLGGRRRNSWDRLHPPQFEIEVFDSSGFALDTLSADPMTRLALNKLPSRIGTWVEDLHLGRPHRQPTKVIVRLVDNEYDDESDGDDDVDPWDTEGDVNLSK